jgi:hypothetical protein
VKENYFVSQMFLKMAPRVEYVSPSAAYYYSESLRSVRGQTGGATVGGLPVFEGSHGILESEQFGEGFWSDFILPGVKAIGKQLLSTGGEIIKDKIQNPGTKLGAAAKRRFIEGGQSLLDKGCKTADSYLEEQKGSGCIKRRRISKKRKRRRKPVKRRSKKGNKKPKRKSTKRRKRKGTVKKRKSGKSSNKRKRRSKRDLDILFQ